MIFTVIFSLLFNLNTNAETVVETYHVVHVKGKIQNMTTKKPLRRGMKIKSSDNLKLSKGSKAVMIGARRGRFILSTKRAKKKGNEFYAFVKDVVSPLKKNAKASTRGAEDTDVESLKGYFGDTDFAIIGDKVAFNLNLSRYPLSKTKLLVCRYEHNGRVINKKLPFEGNTVTFDRNRVFKKNDQTINPDDVSNIEIYYFNRSNRSSRKEASFNVVFVNSEELKSELSELMNIYDKDKTLDDNAKYGHAYTYVRDVHAKFFDEKVFKKWLKSNEFISTTKVKFTPKKSEE
ncbi:hypothetical protein BKI52_12325 [marine bacterium AO1-C]|nr:hypothetical protein BKI52_12325 [marine bacterium AO1-C]